MEPEAFPGSSGMDRVLVWNTPSVTDDSQNAPDIECNRSSASTLAPKQHPLLAKLMEIEEDVKHSEYTAHVLIQKQARDYAYAVEDIIHLLKTGSGQILENVTFWRGAVADESEVESEVDGIGGTNSSSSKSWMSFASLKSNKELEISQIGQKVVQISHAVKKVQEEDALAFWTSEHREFVLRLLVGLSKDLVKFRRKLARIRDSLGEHVRNVRRAAIKCECEISGNVVPSEIYYQWVKEDEKLYKDRRSDHDSFSASNISYTSSKKTATFAKTLKRTAKTLAACLYPDGLLSSSRMSTASTESDASSLDCELITVPNSMKVYQIRKEIEFLLKNSSETSQDEQSVLDESLESLVANAKCLPGRNAGPSPTKIPTVKGDGEESASTNQSEKLTQTAIELEEVWAAKPSQKYLDIIALNMTPPQKFATADYVYDHEEARIREASAEKALPAEEDIMNGHPEGPIEIESVGSFRLPVDKKILSETMLRSIATIKQMNQGIHDIVEEAMLAVREVERIWLSPIDLTKSKYRAKKSTKELYQLLDFVVDTAWLTQNPAFAARIYPEDKHEIVSVLDPVLKELTNCYMTVYVLHNVVMVDGQYLKELVAGFPKGNLVLRDWVSDPSIDDELKDIEHGDGGERTTEFGDVDVDDLFA